MKFIKQLFTKVSPEPSKLPVIKYYLASGKLEKSKENAGYDLSSIDETFVISPGSRTVVSTGLIIELPENFEFQIRPRSGLASKYGITITNAPATIDPGYRGEVKIILQNTSTIPFTVEKGMRIAQGVFNKLDEHALNQVFTKEEISLETERKDSGFGSTGLK